MSDLVAYVRCNHMEVVNLNGGKVAQGAAAFTTTRLLVGNFEVADELLTRLVKEVKPKGLFSAQPRLLIQPLEMMEGGLSQVEERALLELAAGAGARHTRIRVGPKLSTQAALEALNARA